MHNNAELDATFSSRKIAANRGNYSEASLEATLDGEFLMPTVLKSVWIGLVVLTLALIFSVPIFL